MKMKSLAMLAVSSLLLAASVYIAPVLADEMGDNEQITQSIPSDQVAAPADIQNSNASQSSENMANQNTTASNTDQVSPDTATGDDDY